LTAKIKNELMERRRYIRLDTPVNIAYSIPEKNKVGNAVAKNISADGLRFETQDKDINAGSSIELKFTIPSAPNPVHAKGKVVWKKKISLEDMAPYDVGIEFTEIEDDNKNTFLKFLCDLIYNLSKGDKACQ
jgi:hypothetical protein